MKDNHTSAAETGPSVFQSWLTQWKITVVSDSEAKHVLRELVQSHSQFDEQHPFWIAVADFLSKAAVLSSDGTQPSFTQPSFTQPAFTQTGFTQTGHVECDLMRPRASRVYEMEQRIQSLNAPTAKLLLQHLAAVNELKVEQKQFWQMANDALSRYHATRKGQPGSHRKPQ